jgi:hypothetical protein
MQERGPSEGERPRASSSARSGLSARVEQRVRGRTKRGTDARTGWQRGSCGVQVG